MVCEDYAIHGFNSEIGLAYGMVSDGCSRSKDSDIGARLLLTHAKKHQECMREILDTVENNHHTTDICNVFELWLDYARGVAEGALNTAQDMDLDSRAIDATFLSCFANDKWACTASYGDGVHIVKRKIGDEKVIEIEQINYDAGVPAYPVYMTSPELKFAFDNYPGNTTTLTRWSSQGRFEIITGGSPGYMRTYPIEDVEFIAVASDGVFSFQGINCNDVCQALTAFKNKSGEFVKRRMIRAMQDYAKDGHAPYDDVSLASVYCRYGNGF